MVGASMSWRRRHRVVPGERPGALLVVAPLIGAVVLTWWIGAYAIAFGVALLVLDDVSSGLASQPGGGSPWFEIVA